MLVPWRSLNGSHNGTAQCKNGEERKRKKLVEEEANGVNSREFIACRSPLKMVTSFKYLGIVLLTCSRPRRPLFLHALSFESTSNMCITFLNQFLVFFIFKNALHTLVIELCCTTFFFNILQLFIKFTHSFVAIELLTLCKKCKKNYFITQESSHYFG